MTPRKKILLTLAGLFALLGITIAMAFVPIGAAHAPVALGISTAKAALIVLVFMRLPQATSLSRLAFAAGFFWLLIIAALSACDYLTRG